MTARSEVPGGFVEYDLSGVALLMTDIEKIRGESITEEATAAVRALHTNKMSEDIIDTVTLSKIIGNYNLNDEAESKVIDIIMYFINSSRSQSCFTPSNRKLAFVALQRKPCLTGEAFGKVDLYAFHGGYLTSLGKNEVDLRPPACISNLVLPELLKHIRRGTSIAVADMLANPSRHAGALMSAAAHAAAAEQPVSGRPPNPDYLADVFVGLRRIWRDAGNPVPRYSQKRLTGRASTAFSSFVVAILCGICREDGQHIRRALRTWLSTRNSE